MKDLDVEKLIDEIHLKPAIWDMRSDDYSDKLKRKRSWEKVTEVFVEDNATLQQKKETGNLLQKKWKNIRDRYSRELKDDKGKYGQGRKGKKTYMYANQLAFLKDVILHCRMPEASMENMDSPPTPEMAPESPPPFVDPLVIHVAKKRKEDLVEKRLLEAIEAHNKREKRTVQNEKLISCEDDDMLFLASLLPFMKSIPQHFRFAARMDIMQVVNKYMIVQPAASNLYTPQLYCQNPNQATGHQFVQYSNPQPGFTGVQSNYTQTPSLHKREPQPSPSGSQQQRVTLPDLSPASSSCSQDDTELSLF